MSLCGLVVRFLSHDVHEWHRPIAMHLTVKFVTQPGRQDDVLVAMGRTLDVRKLNSTTPWRKMLCQRSDDPTQILYIDTMAPSESVQAYLDAIQPDLAPLLARPPSPRWCASVASFRRWSVEASVVACIVLRIPPERTDDVVKRITERGETFRGAHSGMVAYETLRDQGDPGFLVLVNEWRSMEDLTAYRARHRGGLSSWIEHDIGGETHRYEYHAPALVDLSR